ncbi:MmyB family transcriptional regulator [Streptomyces sp. NPDC003011]
MTPPPPPPSCWHRRRLRPHPRPRTRRLFCETLRATDDPDQTLITYAAEPGNPSHDALRMLLA